MLITLEQFVSALSESGILEIGDFSEFLQELHPEAEISDAESLARYLVQHRKLTTFQVVEILKGKAPGLVFDDYVLLDLLGFGGMGAVYRARRRQDGQLVALKTMPGTFSDDDPFVRRFEQEVAACSRLSHPNIVRILDAGHAHGAPFLVTEYVSGQRLDLLVKRCGPLSIRDSIDCIRQAAVGLEYAHGRGVFHRDVKPSNLLLDEEGRIRILDLGLARLVPVRGAETTPSESCGRLTLHGQILGTPQYMAPEQARNARDADARSDIYSLGCTWHFLLTGEAPYRGQSVVEILMAHRDAPIPCLPAKRPDVSEALDLAFRALVAKDPADRYQSMAEVIAALDDCLLLGEESADGSVSYPSLAHFAHEEYAAPLSNDMVTIGGLQPDETLCDVVRWASPEAVLGACPADVSQRSSAPRSGILIVTLGIVVLLLTLAAVYWWLVG